LRGDPGPLDRRREGADPRGRARPARHRRPGARAQQVRDAGAQDGEGRSLRAGILDRRGGGVTPTTGRWVSVARASEIPVGGSQLVRIDDVPLAVFHLDDGWYAIEDVCTHDGGPVAEGHLAGAIIECPRHGATFDVRTGAALSFPAVSPVPTYPVRIVGDDGKVGGSWGKERPSDARERRQPRNQSAYGRRDPAGARAAGASGGPAGRGCRERGGPAESEASRPADTVEHAVRAGAGGAL